MHEPANPADPQQPNNEFDTGAKLVLRTQFVLLAMTVIITNIGWGQAAAIAALYGGFIVIFTVWITHKRLLIANHLAQVAPGKEIGALYAAAMQRFVFTILFFFVGMAILKLMPAPMLISFAITYLGYLGYAFADQGE